MSPVSPTHGAVSPLCARDPSAVSPLCPECTLHTRALPCPARMTAATGEQFQGCVPSLALVAPEALSPLWLSAVSPPWAARGHMRPSRCCVPTLGCVPTLATVAALKCCVPACPHFGPGLQCGSPRAHAAVQVLCPHFGLWLPQCCVPARDPLPGHYRTRLD